MNIITFTARSRAEIVAIHTAILDGMTRKDGKKVAAHLGRLEEYTTTLAHSVFSAKQDARHANSGTVA